MFDGATNCEKLSERCMPSKLRRQVAWEMPSLDEAKDEAESYDSRVRLGGAKVKYFDSYE
jgi:hypothetical protein